MTISPGFANPESRGGHVYGIPQYSMSSLFHIHLTSNDKTSANARMHSERLSNPLFILGADRRNNFMNFSGGFDCSDRIIFMRLEHRK